MLFANVPVQQEIVFLDPIQAQVHIVIDFPFFRSRDYLLQMDRGFLLQDIHSANQAFHSVLFMFEDLKAKYELLSFDYDNLQRENAAYRHVCERDAARFKVASTQIFEIGFLDGGKWGKKEAMAQIEELKLQMETMMKKNQQLEISQRDFDITSASAKDLRIR
jgi:hypothetical protein